MEQKPLVNERLLLERFPGKGGWTFARLPEIPKTHRNHFGTLKVRGFIDDYELRHFNLMPMGKGELFVPVKAEIRKAIGKAEGDWVNIILYSAETPLPLPEDFQLCLQDEPLALKNFEELSETRKRECLDWIYAIRSEEAIINRMADAINKLVRNEPLLTPKKE